MRWPVNARWLMVVGFLVHAGALTVKAATCDLPVKVGYRVMTFATGPKVGVWYPTTDAEAPYQYLSGVTGSVAHNGAVANCGALPLVLFSHGYGGCGVQSVFITEEIARHGYLVAAPDHKDAQCSVDGSGTVGGIVSPQESFLDPASWTTATYSDRKDDLLATIAGMLASAEFGSAVDTARIGVSGHSLGGYTALGIVGGWASWKDSRIKAALLLSPYSMPFQVQNLLPSVSVPLMYQGATFDILITPFLHGGNGAYDVSNPPRFFAETNGGTHFEWTNLLCQPQSSVASCLAAQPNATLIDNYAIGFLDKYVKNADSSLLLGNGAGLMDYERTLPATTVSSASLLPGSTVSGGSIASIFGQGLCSTTASATDVSAAVPLGGCSVSVIDGQGAQRLAVLFYVSPGQINFVVPQNSAAGTLKVNAAINGKVVAQSTVTAQSVAPSLFSANASGSGVAAGVFVRATAQGTTVSGLLFDSNLSAVPVDLGASTDQVYLELFGTGMRGVQQGASATIGGQPVPLAGPVPQGQFIGLDQVNLGPLPRSLAGSGQANISLSVDGRAANIVTVTFK